MIRVWVRAYAIWAGEEPCCVLGVVASSAGRSAVEGRFRPPRMCSSASPSQTLRASRCRSRTRERAFQPFRETLRNPEPRPGREATVPWTGPPNMRRRTSPWRWTHLTLLGRFRDAAPGYVRALRPEPGFPAIVRAETHGVLKAEPKRAPCTAGCASSCDAVRARLPAQKDSDATKASDGRRRRAGTMVPSGNGLAGRAGSAGRSCQGRTG